MYSERILRLDQLTITNDCGCPLAWFFICSHLTRKQPFVVISKSKLKTRTAKEEERFITANSYFAMIIIFLLFRLHTSMMEATFTALTPTMPETWDSDPEDWCEVTQVQEEWGNFCLKHRRMRRPRNVRLAKTNKTLRTGSASKRETVEVTSNLDWRFTTLFGLGNITEWPKVWQALILIGKMKGYIRLALNTFIEYFITTYKGINFLHKINQHLSVLRSFVLLLYFNPWSGGQSCFSILHEMELVQQINLKVLITGSEEDCCRRNAGTVM